MSEHVTKTLQTVPVEVYCRNCGNRWTVRVGVNEKYLSVVTACPKCNTIRGIGKVYSEENCK